MGAALAAIAALAAPASADTAVAPGATTAAATPPSTLCALGDSITYGLSGGVKTNGTTEETYTPGGYRGFLDAGLNEDGVAHRFVGTTTANASTVLSEEGEAAHDGHPGYRVDQETTDLNGRAGGASDDGGYWMTRSDDPVVPAVAIIILGTNDILGDYDPATTFPTANGQADYNDPSQVSTFVGDLAERVASLVQAIESLHPGTRIVLGDVPPRGKTTPDTVTGPYGKALAGLAAQETSAGISTSFVDLWSVFVHNTPNGLVIVQGTLGPDGIHPTSTGYQMMADALRGPVEQQLKAAA